MAINPLFKKPDNMKFWQLSKWLDDNFYSEDCDYDKAFSYMYSLAYMLACKAPWKFQNIDDYDGFAYYLALSVFYRMRAVNIKSALNYMKSIMNFRRMSYQADHFSEILDDEHTRSWSSDKFMESCMSIEERKNRQIAQEYVNSILGSIPKLVKSNIPSVYASNKLMSNKLYMSTILTLLNRYTLPVKKEEQFKIAKTSTKFNESDFFNKNLDDEIILWRLPQSMESVVKCIINKVYNILRDDIGDIISKCSMSFGEYSMLSSAELCEEKFKDEK